MTPVSPVNHLVTEVNLYVYWPVSYFISEISSFEIVRILRIVKLDDGSPSTRCDLLHTSVVWN